MGVIDRIIGISSGATAIGAAAGNLAEVFTQNQTRRMELDEEAFARAINQMAGEFENHQCGFFDGLVNGLNRLPRPVMTLGTLGLFSYAMVDPAGFGLRMQGLALIPEPLWWLFGAIISFYFGAREAHYFRTRQMTRDLGKADVNVAVNPSVGVAASDSFADNAALRDWAARM